MLPASLGMCSGWPKGEELVPGEPPKPWTRWDRTGDGKLRLASASASDERVLGWPASAKFQGRAWAGVHLLEKRTEKGKRLWENSRSFFRPPSPIFFPPRGSSSFAFRARVFDLITVSARVAPLGTARLRRVVYPRLASRGLLERVDQGLGVHPAEMEPGPAQPAHPASGVLGLESRGA